MWILTNPPVVDGWLPLESVFLLVGTGTKNCCHTNQKDEQFTGPQIVQKTPRMPIATICSYQFVPKCLSFWNKNAGHWLHLFRWCAGVCRGHDGVKKPIIYIYIYISNRAQEYGNQLPIASPQRVRPRNSFFALRTWACWLLAIWWRILLLAWLLRHLLCDFAGLSTILRFWNRLVGTADSGRRDRKHGLL